MMTARNPQQLVAGPPLYAGSVVGFLLCFVIPAIAEVPPLQAIMMMEQTQGELRAATDNDIAHVSSVLSARNGYEVTRLFGGDPNQLELALNRRINEVKFTANQTMLYYRGHVHIENGDAFLALTEGPKGGKEIPTRIAFNEVLNNFSRSVQDGVATVILDIGMQGGESFQDSVKSLKLSIKNAMPSMTSRVAVIACCLRRDHFVWQKRGQSHVSYHVRRGMSGLADANSDESVTVGELSSYLKRSLGDKASVIAEVSAADVSSRQISRVRPLQLEELLSDLAVELSADLHRQDVGIVAIPHFVVPEGSEDGIPGQEFGPLMRFCLQKLKYELAEWSNSEYRIIDDAWLTGRLSDYGVEPGKLNADNMNWLVHDVSRKRREDIPEKSFAVLSGSMSINGEQIRIACQPFTLDGRKPKCVSGTATLSGSEWAMIGLSAAKNPEAIEKPAVTLDYNLEQDRLLAAQETRGLMNESSAKHPMANPHFDFQLSVAVAGESLPLQQSADARHAFVTLQPGDHYQIRLKNDREAGVFVRLLVDGLNTLPDRPLLQTQNLFEVAVKDKNAPEQPAPHASLTNARAWYCEPGSYLVPGFLTSIKKDSDEAVYRDFVVTDAASSEAWEQGYRKDVGMITAAFYEPLKRPRSMAIDGRLGTKMGTAARRTAVKKYEGKKVPGKLIAVIHLRYGSKDEETNE